MSKPKDAEVNADGGAGAENTESPAATENTGADIAAPEQTAGANVTTETTQAGADEASIAESIRRARSRIESDAEATAAAKSLTTPDATYTRGAPEGVNVNRAVSAGHPAITTYEDALEAGYFGVAPGHANTEGLSVAAVTARDRALGLPGSRGLKGASLNGTGAELKPAQTKD